jgi:predicted membrane protein
VTTRADVGVGQVKVLVPEGVTVRLSVDVGIGDLQLPGDDKKDVDVKPGQHQEMTLSPAAGVEKSGTIDLDLQVGMGQAEVARAAS